MYCITMPVIMTIIIFWLYFYDIYFLGLQFSSLFLISLIYRFFLFFKESEMPLAPYANGQLSAVGPAAELKLDDLVLEDRKVSGDDRTISITTEEKADTSHFALLKVLGQG